MQYRKDRKGNDISALGFGCMRFKRKGNGIDTEETEKQILRAIELGINYFDTAYIYSGSEACLGEILEKNHVRDKINIASKLPQYFIRNRASIEKYFREQLSRLRTDHIDYYLMHMLTDVEAWSKLVDMGIREWIAEKKSCGEIGQIGFSFHGNTEMFLKILNAYDWDFCQIQYNYLDETSQAGKAGLQAAAARGIPVMIMEPLRGGKLVNLLPQDARDLILRDLKGRTAAELAFSWLWNQPEVTCVLSGMNSLEMLEENCRTASSARPNSFSEEDQRMIESLRSAIREKIKVGCTGCAYCMPCPQGVDIPGTFRCYNTMYTESRSNGRHEFMQTIALQKETHFASQCIGCGKCEKHCPQHLSIREELRKADAELRPFYYKAGIRVARWWLFDRKRGSSKDKIH